MKHTCDAFRWQICTIYNFPSPMTKSLKRKNILINTLETFENIHITQKFPIPHFHTLRTLKENWVIGQQREPQPEDWKKTPTVQRIMWFLCIVILFIKIWHFYVFRCFEEQKVGGSSRWAIWWHICLDPRIVQYSMNILYLTFSWYYSCKV